MGVLHVYIVMEAVTYTDYAKVERTSWPRIHGLYLSRDAAIRKKNRIVELRYWPVQTSVWAILRFSIPWAPILKLVLLEIQKRKIRLIDLLAFKKIRRRPR